MQLLNSKFLNRKFKFSEQIRFNTKIVFWLNMNEEFAQSYIWTFDTRGKYRAALKILFVFGIWMSSIYTVCLIDRIIVY